MIQTTKRSLIILFVYLVSSSAFAINLDNEVCALYEGGTCGSGTEMFLIHMREGNNETNRDRCNTLPAICNAPDIDTWIRMYHQSGGGRRGYRTSYSFGSAKLDQNGVLTDLKGKAFVRCFKKRRHADWEAQAAATCGTVPPQPCTNGKVLVNNVCKSPPGVFDTDNSNSVHGYQVSQSLVTLAAEHNNGASQIVANPYQPGAGGNNIPGENGNTTGVDLGAQSGGNSSNSGKPAIGSVATGSLGGFGSSASEAALAKANAALASLDGSVDAGAGGVSGEISGGNSALRSQGGQLITNPDVLPGNPGPGSDSMDFKSRGLAGADANSASRGKSSEDPADYFTRTEMNTSLFKIVTSRLRHEQADWILSEKPKRYPAQQGANTAR